MNINQIVNLAIEKQLVTDTFPVIGIIEFDALSQACQSLLSAFPAHFQHHFAVKANPLIEVLAHLKSAGLSMEVASEGELQIVKHIGFNNSEIVLDSPTKTRTQLKDALRDGISINLDNLQELERVAELLAAGLKTDSLIGMRVNPQLGAGKILSTSTAAKHSKFGQPIADNESRQAVIDAYLTYPWLKMLHIHAGSQGFALDYHVNAIREVVDLANHINQLSEQAQITTIDIGGGLSVNFESDTITPTFHEFSSALKVSIPELFSGKYQVKTEFGRALCAKAGLMISRVEYTKTADDRRIISTHIGAQVMTRTAFLPEAWPMRVSLFSPDGNKREEDIDGTDVAGPLCFAGDLVAQNRALPKSYPDDFIVVHDCGGYYFTNHFDYNCLPLIPVYQHTSHGGLICIRRGGTAKDIVEDYRKL